MTKNILLASVAFAFASVVALPAEAGAWSGIYLGAHAGGVWGSVDTTLVDENASFYTSTPVEVDFSPSGVFGGGQIGYNYQMSSWVFGAELSGSAGDLDETLARGSDSVTVKSDWNASASLRAGYAFNYGALIYLKGGYAMADLQHSAIDFDQVRRFSDSNNVNGWTAGVGYEYMISSDVSVGVEYSYTDYGTENFYADVVGEVARFATHDIDTKFQAVSARLNWHFSP